jgi:hypothetical protein
MTLDEMKADYDWREAFGYTGHVLRGSERTNRPMLCAGATCTDDPVGIDDVGEIVAYENGENDEADWIGVFRLLDGRWLFLAAWCDFTGWDCQAGGQGWVAEDFERLCQFAINDSAASRLGIDRATSTIAGEAR